jgi:hypothetical protein
MSGLKQLYRADRSARPGQRSFASGPRRQTGSSRRERMSDEVGTAGVHRVDAAVARHHDVVRVYEEAFNAHTFDFEKDVGRFAAPDITIVSESELGGRDLLAALSNARAEYVRTTGATVSIVAETTCVSYLGTTVVLVTDGKLLFSYPDRKTYALPILASSVLQLVNDLWVFEHVHFAR